MGTEIERKFLLDVRPAWLDRCESRAIEQGYLALEEAAEVRVRRIDGRGVLTVKRGHGERRGEQEIALSAEQLEALWPLTAGRRVAKRRYLVPGEHGTFEVDLYEGELAGLLVAEIEFDSEAASERFEPPDWLGREVTGDERYENRSLAIEGRPKASPG